MILLTQNVVYGSSKLLCYFAMSLIQSSNEDVLTARLYRYNDWYLLSKGM